GARRYDLQLPGGAAQGVHLDPPFAVGAAQEVLESLLQAGFAHQIRGPVARLEVAAIRKAQVADEVPAQGAVRVFPHPFLFPQDARERRSEEHTSELQSRENLVCRLLLEK